MNFYDIAYGLGLSVASPFWLIKPSARRKVLKALRERMGKVPGTAARGPAVMIHAVSLGELNAARSIIAALVEARPGLRFIVSTTTDTGYARGRELYSSDPNATSIRYPLDFSGAIKRVLDGLKPDLVILMELEVWPNFMLQCERRGIPVVLVNGRLTERSYHNYRLGGMVTRRMFGRLTAVCAQEQSYAERFVALGVPRERVAVTGTMKFDTAQVSDRIEGAAELAREVGLRPGEEPIWVCGSTGPGEEQIVLEQYRKLLDRHPTLRLVIVPRKPERFDEAEEQILGSAMNVIRRSQPPDAAEMKKLMEYCSPPVILGDTMGELRKFYSLADIVFVGRTLVDLGPRQHGSDMIEPAALGKPVIVGPFTGNFAEVMNQFHSAGAMSEVRNPDELFSRVQEMLSDRAAATGLGLRAQEVVREQRGATRRNLEVVLRHLPTDETPHA